MTSISPSEPPSGAASRASDGVAGAPERSEGGRWEWLGVGWRGASGHSRWCVSDRNGILTVDSILMENSGGGS